MMKKTILALVASSTLMMASENITVSATMSLMFQGLNKVQSGLMHNNKADIKDGLSTLENANAIFTKVDVSTFIKNNNKVQVTKNISANLNNSLADLSKATKSNNLAGVTKAYAKVMQNCLACHTIVRGW